MVTVLSTRTLNGSVDGMGALGPHPHHGARRGRDENDPPLPDLGESPAAAADADHVDLYGYASMAVGAIQAQERRIDALNVVQGKSRGGARVRADASCSSAACAKISTPAGNGGTTQEVRDVSDASRAGLFVCHRVRSARERSVH